MEHHLEVSPAGCFAASWKARTDYWAACLQVIECACVHEGTSGGTNNSTAREIWHKEERASGSLKRSREWRMEEKKEGSSLGGLLMSSFRRMEQKASRKWGANNSSFPSLPLFLCLSLSPFFQDFIKTSHQTLAHEACMCHRPQRHVSLYPILAS